MKRLVIMQPAYLPWLGYFQRMMLGDEFVLLDHVGMDYASKTKFANRNQILVNGKPEWLTVPVLARGENRGMPIKDIPLADGDWRDKHIAKLRAAYGETKHLSALLMSLYPVLRATGLRTLGDVAAASMYGIVDALGEWVPAVTAGKGEFAPLIRSSKLDCQFTKSDLILEICMKRGASHYVSGPYGTEYLNTEKFREAGIKVLIHSYVATRYQQGNGTTWIPNLSAVDAFCWLGKEKTMQLLTNPYSAALSVYV